MNRLFALVLMASALGAAQGRGAEPDDAKKLAESAAKWAKAKVECGGNYSYQVRFSSFAGFGHVTTIIVKDNKVVERNYLEFSSMPVPLGEKPPEPKIKWTETGKDLGKNKEGADPKTLDELYEIAKGIVEKEIPADHVRSLGIDKNGLLAYCFLRDKRIADDAPLKGVKPITLTLGKK